jgi:integrase
MEDSPMPRQEPNKRQLNNLMIERLQPKDRPYLIWDTYQRGLAIRVEPSGHQSWKVIYSRHGRPRWYSIGRVDAIDLAAARKLAGKIMVRVADGEDPQADRKAERSSGTFGELAILYRDHAKKENKSWQQADKLVNRYLLPKWSKLQSGSITRSDVKNLIGKITAPILANQVLASASAIFTWAIKEELARVKVNPCSKVDRNKTTIRERILSDSEIPQFWTAFDDASLVSLVEGMALKMILLTGQRPGEVAHMRTEHIVDGWWEMPGDPIAKLNWPGTKNAQSHRIWLPKAAQQIIEEIGTSGMIFAGARGMAVNGLDKDMRAICKKLKVKRATPHDLRRTHGSTITGLSFGRDAMNRIQNHREGGIADVYDQHEYADENKKILESVANKFMSLINGGADTNVINFSKAQ